MHCVADGCSKHGSMKQKVCARGVKGNICKGTCKADMSLHLPFSLHAQAAILIPVAPAETAVL